MENQDIMDQFLENRQNYMMDNNIQQHMNNATAGCENVANVGVGGVEENVGVGGVGGGEILGVKYDEQLQQHHEEHDVGDDDEWKYVKEVQQSEKQQQQQTLKSFGFGDDGGYDSNELAEKEIAKGGSHEFGNGGGLEMGAFVFGGGQHVFQQDHQDMFNVGNGHNTNGHDEIHQNVDMTTNEDFINVEATGFKELNPFDNEMVDFKNEGDFSSTSNNTESVEEFVPQVDVKIETKPELGAPEQHELVEEDEPSSLATNTTNGTSSLSENVPQATAPAPANAFDDFMSSMENKENADPLTPQRPDNLDIDQALSQLNPDAKEFIPSFGSNPASPTSPFATGMSSDLGEPMETQMYFGQQPSAVPRHLLGDDFVAQSPRKGKGDNSMDSVPLPKELAEFEEEADKRPHELETDDVLQNRDGVMTPDQQVQQLPLDDIVNDIEVQDPSSAPQDITDFQPSSFMDHGPETCVDLDVDLDLQPEAVLNSLQQDDDVMKRSMYVASDDAAIEDVLNSVQPIPTEIDSVNNSFIEESATESAAANLAHDKELLQVEEKEHVSHSPSTEEMQMNLQNTLHSSNKDIPQLPIDMDNANNMQESMYEPQEPQPPEQQQIESITTTEVLEESLLADTTNPLIANDDSFLNNSFEREQLEVQESFDKIVDQTALTTATGLESLNFELTEQVQQQQESLSDVMTPLSTTDEKHLIEETKEQQLFSVSGLEQQMSDMMLSNDGHLSQAEEVAVSSATTAIDDVSEHLISPDAGVVLEHDQLQKKMLVDESFNEFEQEESLRHEESQQNESIENPIQEIIEIIESPIHNQQLESEMVAVEEPIIEAKQAAPLFNTEETEIVNVPQKQEEEETQQEIIMCMVPETAPAEYLEPPQSTPIETEIVKTEEEPKPQEDIALEVVEEPKLQETNVAAVAATAAAVVATTAVAAAAVTKAASCPTKKTDSAKKPLAKSTTSTTAKPKVGGTSAATTAAKKPLETAAKKPIGLAARPRAIPAKPAPTTAATEKKTLTKTTTTTTTARKPLSAGTSTAPKPAVKTTTTTSTTRTTARPTTTTTRPATAPRTITSTTTTRKPLTSSSTTTTNGPAAKPRPATAPAKPTSLGLPATNGAAKTKVTSPRATLTSQLRKPLSGSTTTTTTAKSPVKLAATNGTAKTATTSTLASRTKTTTSSASSTTHGTTTTKPFTARPAPKFTTSSSSTTTTTTTRRLTVGGHTTAATTTTTTKTSSTPLRKSSPSKPLGGRTPTKTTTTTTTSKSKTPIAKKELTPQKPAPIRKPVDKTLINGDANISKELNNGLAEEQQPLQNAVGDLQQAVHQNGDSNIPIQSDDNQQQPLIEQRDEQIPMDIINA